MQIIHSVQHAFLSSVSLRWTLAIAILAPAIPGTADDEFFEKQVRPLLVKHCYQCHSGDKSGGGLSLESRQAWQRGGDSGPVIVAGKPTQSVLVDAINYRGPEMPPADAGGKLSQQQIQVLTRWIAQGAHDPRDESDKLGGMTKQQVEHWWSFQPLPSGQDLTSDRIDQLIYQELKNQDLVANTHADRRTLIRRATFDLTGLPPTPEEVVSFVNDNSPDAFAKLIDRLLDSPQYGMRWGRHWLDVVRYADTAGENTDRPLPHAWRYRNWVIDAFNQDMPFDEFVKLQIAGDLLLSDRTENERRRGIVATGYLAVARRFGHDIDKDIHLMHEDVIDNLGKNFLGLTLGCARCHDHKYDPILSQDYYALYGIFSSTRFAFPGCEPKGQPRDLVPLIPQQQADRLTSLHAAAVEKYEALKSGFDDARVTMRELAASSFEVLVSKNVGEGKTSDFSGAEAVQGIAMRKGEVLQLAVLRNDNYGADSTLLQWEIVRQSDSETWRLQDLVPRLIEAGPSIEDRGATWCFLDVTDGPKFLVQRGDSIDNRSELRKWSDPKANPSVFVNASDAPVNVWTTLPPYSLFVHPGPAEDVAVSWVCPADGEYRLSGLVADAHPAPSLDGVSYRIEHFASSALGEMLVRTGKDVYLSLTQPAPVAPSIPVAYAVVDGNVGNARMQQRGDPETLGEEVPRRWLSVFGANPLEHPDSSGREELAQWVTTHPLLARVMANRIWQGHFGAGIVATPNDFGSRGAPPVHPQLLEELASAFQDSGYKIKAMHRLIMNTSAYQRSSVVSGGTSGRDPSSQYLARFIRQRLSAEQLRDALLSIGGNLDKSMGREHPFPPEAQWGFTQHAPFNAVYDTDRRSVFLMVQRQRRHPYLALFDGADPNSSTPSRESTTVATQALYFFNDPFFHAQARRVAERAMDNPSGSPRITRLFQLILQRNPTKEEIEQATAFMSRYRASELENTVAYSRVLLASNEFLYLD